jgi:hypothetical protein
MLSFWVECTRAALPILSPSGVLIRGNTYGLDWPVIAECPESIQELPFSGMAPQEVAFNRTTISHRHDNCLKV